MELLIFILCRTLLCSVLSSLYTYLNYLLKAYRLHFNAFDSQVFSDSMSCLGLTTFLLELGRGAKNFCMVKK